MSTYIYDILQVLTGRYPGGTSKWLSESMSSGSSTCYPNKCRNLYNISGHAPW